MKDNSITYHEKMKGIKAGCLTNSADDILLYAKMYDEEGYKHTFDLTDAGVCMKK